MRKNLFIYATALWLGLHGTGFGQTATPPNPQIVARVNLTGQTNPIPTTTIFTPPVDGLFRISGVMVTTVANGDSSGTWGLGVNWSPDPGPQTLCCVIGTNTRFVGGGGSVETITIRSDAGIPVTYFVQSTGNTQGTTYEVFFTVERLE